MSAQGTPSGGWGVLQKAARRLAPSYEMEVDLVAVSRVASCSTAADWAAGTLSNVFVTPRGEVQLSTGGSGLTLLDTTTGSPTVSIQGFMDTGNQPQEFAVDVFIDPANTGGQPITLSTLTLRLVRNAIGPTAYFTGQYQVSVSTYDDQWRKVPLGDPVLLSDADSPFFDGIVTIDFVQDYGREFVIDTAQLRTRTGPGLDASGNVRNVDVVDGLSQLNVFRALSIGITPVGRNPAGAGWGIIPALPIFQPSDFWRGKGNSVGQPKRNQGPYFPRTPPIAPATDTNLDGFLVTGAVPGYGARSCAVGEWGIARRVTGENRAQAGEAWSQPYVKVTARTVQPSGAAVVVLDLGAVPTTELQFRADDWVRRGTNITYSLRGRNLTGDAWTSIGAVLDGGVIASPFRYYEVTATLTSLAASGGFGLVSPSLQAVQITERVRYRTEGLTGTIDADATIDPVTGQSSIGELSLSLQRGPREDFRDLATSLAAGVSPSRLEAHVFGVDRTTGFRRFLDAYRLESRTPYRDREEFRFVSGLDRLQVRIPPQVETYALPLSGAAYPTITVSGSGGTRTLTVSGASWAIGQITGFRVRPINGAANGTDYDILSSPTTTSLTIAVPASGVLPSTGDAIEIRSDVYRRQDVVYTNQDAATVYEDVLITRARVPRRLLGALPATGRIVDPAGTPLLTSGRLKASGGSDDGVTALSVLQALANLLGGGITWRRGLITFVDLFTPGESVAVWDERDYLSLESPTGLDRRMPSVSCKFGADPASDTYAGEVVANDLNVLNAAGRANLFDVTAVDEGIAKWCTTQEFAIAHVSRLRDAFSAGVPVWTVPTVHQWPWVEIGDVVTIMTDQFTTRIFRFSADGATDESLSVSGRTATVGVVIGRNLAADRFLVLARSTTKVPDGSTGGGPNDGPLDGIGVPTVTLTAIRGGVQVAYTPPTSAYFARMEYDVRSRTTAGPGAWTALTRLAGSAGGVDFIPFVADVNTDVEVTPITVSTAQVRRIGTPVIVGVSATAGGTAAISVIAEVDASSTATTQVVNVRTVPAGGTVAYIGGTVAPSATPPGVGTGVFTASPALWSFPRAAFRGGEDSAQFRGMVGATSDDDIILITEQGRDTVPILTRAAVVAETATSVTVRVSASTKFAEVAGTITLADRGAATVVIGGSGALSVGDTRSITISTDPTTFGGVYSTDYTITKPAVGSLPARVVWRVDDNVAALTPDLDAVDVQARVPLLQGRIDDIVIVYTGATAEIRFRFFDASGVRQNYTAGADIDVIFTSVDIAGTVTDTGASVSYIGGGSDYLYATFTRVLKSTVSARVRVAEQASTGTARLEQVVPVQMYDPAITIGAFINVPTTYGVMTGNWSPTNAPAGATFDVVFTDQTNGTGYKYNVASGVAWSFSTQGQLFPSGGFNTPRTANMTVTMKNASGGVVATQSVSATYHVAP